MSEATLSPAKRLAFGAIAAGLFTLGPILLLEGAASAWVFARETLHARVPRSLNRPHTVHDTLLGWTNARGYANADEFGPGRGLRLSPQGVRAGAATPAAPSAARVICSGDSFTFGVGVDDTDAWCARLAGELTGVESVNLGVPAYGLDQSILRYRRDGVPLAPRVHVLAITDAALERSLSGSDKGWSKPYFDLENGRIDTRNVPVPSQSAGPLRLAAITRAVDDLRFVQLARRLRGVDGYEETAAAVDERMPVVERALQELAESERGRGTTLVLCYLPTLRAAWRNERVERRRRLAAFAAAHEIPFVDLTPRARAMRRDSLDLAFLSAATPRVPQGVLGQYSRLGHQWIATVLARELDTLGVLAAPATLPVPGRPARSSISGSARR